MLFVWGELLPAKTAGEVFGISEEEAVDLFDELQTEYETQGRGIAIRRAGNSFQLTTKEENADFVRRLCTPVKVRRLSQAALEVLAIIAYRQPVTKAEMEAIRGVKCDRIVEGLLAKGLIEGRGRSRAAGRPILYGTTEAFLARFGFETLEDLPEIGDPEDFITDFGEESEDAMQLRLDLTGSNEPDDEA